MPPKSKASTSTAVTNQTVALPPSLQQKPRSTAQSATAIYHNNQKVRFCQHCQNIMEAVAINDQLEWKCSIDCPHFKLDSAPPTENSADVDADAETSTGREPKEAVILSASDNSEISTQTDFLNKFAIYDPTLLRCQRYCPHCHKQTEMVLFKQSGQKQTFICTNCSRGV